MDVLHFECRPSLYHYTNLHASTLELTIRVVNEDGSELTGPDLLTGYTVLLHTHAYRGYSCR